MTLALAFCMRSILCPNIKLKPQCQNMTNPSFAMQVHASQNQPAATPLTTKAKEETPKPQQNRRNRKREGEAERWYVEYVG